MYLLCVGLLVGVCAIMIENWTRKKVLEQRIEDVRRLTEAYFESTNVTSIEEVIDFLRRKGVKLNNPIAEDPSQPCYRLVINGQAEEITTLIEETNVRDKHWIVRSFTDGSVVVMKRVD